MPTTIIINSGKCVIWTAEVVKLKQRGQFACQTYAWYLLLVNPLGVFLPSICPWYRIAIFFIGDDTVTKFCDIKLLLINYVSCDDQCIIYSWMPCNNHINNGIKKFSNFKS